MDQNLIRTDLLPETLPVLLLVALAAGGLALWAVAHWALRRYGSNRFGLWTRAAIGVFPGTVASWLTLQAASRFVAFQTPWPLLLIACAGGVAVEAVSAFYGHECARISPRIGRTLVACRLAAVVAALVMLAQPVLVGEKERTVHRRVLVLIDDSSSMTGQDDVLMSEEERAGVARALGIGTLPPMTRGEMVRRLMEVGGERSPLKTAAGRFSVDVFRFGSGLRHDDGRSPTTEPDAKEQAFRSATDISRALELALEEVPVEEITGVLLFTDGRHNGETSVGSVARRFASYGIRVDSVVVGGSVKPFDIVLASVDCPESVFAEDKVRFIVRLNATQANGREIRLSLYDDSDPIFPRAVIKPDSDLGTKMVVDSDDWTREVRLSLVPGVYDDMPPGSKPVVSPDGLFRYRLQVDAYDGELSVANNVRRVDVAVSDDRTNVLLVDDRPRWEYRYLRNLFYGRDKSVHLQDWIVHPDMIAGVPSIDLPPASAGREFGQSAAGGFPTTLDEWRKFDIIILGDLGEDVLTPDVVSNIRTCVEERGALLVLISGSEKMPMSIRSAALRDLMPIVYEPSDRSFRDAPEADFRLSLASAGRGHPVMSLASSPYESEEIWNALPDFHWRLPIGGVKDDAEVLAYAQEKKGESKIGYVSEAATFAAALDRDPEEAIARMKEMRESQNRKALVAAATRGKGRVLMLMTDSMWRLRSKLGDQHHHRFWGQVMRWGAGERLRAGSEHVRLGTDRLSYGAGEPIRIYARVLDGQLRGLDGLDIKAVIHHKSSTSSVTCPLTVREGSNGFYEAVLQDGYATPGEYRVEFVSREAMNALGGLFPSETVSTEFVVTTARRPVEDVDLTATREFVSVLADQTGGRVYSPEQYINDFVADHPDTGDDGTKTVRDRTEVRLWSSPGLFVFIVLALTVEWILRKRVRLA